MRAAPFLILALLLAGCADERPEGATRPFQGDVVPDGPPLSLADAWSMADSVADTWGGEVYWLAGKEQDASVKVGREDNDDRLGDGVLNRWTAEIRDPTTMDALLVTIHGAGVAEWSRPDAGAMAPASQWNLTPPPGDAWLERLPGIPGWTDADAFAFEWEWSATRGIRVTIVDSLAAVHPPVHAFDHAGWSLNGDFERTHADETLWVVGIHEHIAFYAEHPGAGPALAGETDFLRIQAPNGTTWSMANGDSLTLADPAAGAWRVTSSTGQGLIDSCTSGLIRGSSSEDRACAYLP